MATTRIIYATVFAPHPKAVQAGKYVRVMIYDQGQKDNPKRIDFAENLNPDAFKFFSQLDDHYMRLG